MSGDPAPRRSVVGEDEQTAHRNAIPVELTGYPAAEPNLAIERGQHRLQIRHDRLDLDHQEHAGAWMEREHVDGPALAFDREGDLCRARPPHGPHPNKDLLDQARMLGIEQSVDGLTVEIETHERPCAENPSDPFQGANRHPVGSTTFQSGNH
jgi:hypothetical protein